MDKEFFELTDRSNSIQKYNFFLKNMQAETTLEKEVEDFLKKKKVVRILDLGCGKAQALKELKEKFGSKVFIAGIDLVKTDGLDEFFEASALEASFPKNIDLVVSFRAMHFFSPLDVVFEKISGCLAKGGKAFLSVRCQQFVGSSLLFHGNLNAKDLDFLKKISKEKSCFGVKCLVIEVKEKKTIVLINPTSGRKIPAQIELVHGANVFLKN